MKKFFRDIAVNLVSNFIGGIAVAMVWFYIQTLHG